MNCETFEHELDGLIAGHATDGLRDRLQAHLAGCARCRELAEDFRRLLDAAPAEPPALSADFTARVMSTLSGCAEFHDALDEYAAGRLIGPAREKADAHRGVCPVCREAVESYEQVLRAAESLPPALSAGFTERVMSAVAGRRGGTTIRMRWVRRVAAAAAVAALVVLIGRFVGSPGGRDDGSITRDRPVPEKPGIEAVARPPLPEPAGVVDAVKRNLRETIAAVALAPTELPDPIAVRETLVQAALPAAAAVESDAAWDHIGRDGARLVRVGAELTRETAGGLAGFLLRQGRLFDVGRKVQGS